MTMKYRNISFFYSFCNYAMSIRLLILLTLSIMLRTSIAYLQDSGADLPVACDSKLLVVTGMSSQSSDICIAVSHVCNCTYIQFVLCIGPILSRDRLFSLDLVILRVRSPDHLAFPHWFVQLKRDSQLVISGTRSEAHSMSSPKESRQQQIQYFPPFFFASVDENSCLSNVP